jgi:dTDP-4-dehydrorhamnose reductase
MTTTLIFGASGQLGHCLKKVTEEKNIQGFTFPDEKEANILDEAALQNLFEKHQPAYIVNCAAYTAVDKAEDDVDRARQINRDGAENLAKLAKKFNSVLIHVSTDFVFEGNVPQLLTETDAANPINVYGLTKLEGEQVIAAQTDKYFTLRTSWLYSEYGNNFVKTMLRLGSERPELRVIADQVGTPTYAVDLAETIVTIITSGSTAYGLYHYSNEGVTSWYDFAVAVFDIAGKHTSVVPVTTAEYVTRAVRPKFSVMDKAKIKDTFKIKIPYWRESLVKCINALN